MYDIRRQHPDDLDEIVRITSNAFPTRRELTPEGIEREKKRLTQLMEDDPEVECYGLYEDDVLIALARYYRFRTNLFGRVVETAGIGSLAVDLLHKKKQSAFKLMRHFESWAKENELPLGMLLPFRPDFYKRLGYGFGSKFHEYRIAPENIPIYKTEMHLQLIKPSEIEWIAEYHKKKTEQTHGLNHKLKRELRVLQEDREARYVASFDEDENMEGYLRFRFQKPQEAGCFSQHLIADEWFVDSPKVLRKLLEFIRRQSDQVELVIFHTSLDDFHLLFDNPLDTSGECIPHGNVKTNTQYTGIMYKVFSFEQSFRQFEYRRYGEEHLAIAFEVLDEQEEDVLESFTVGFQGAKGMLAAQTPDVHVRLKGSDFSSLFMGSVRFHSLVDFGLAQIDDPGYIQSIDRLFYLAQRPQCNSDF